MSSLQRMRSHFSKLAALFRLRKGILYRLARDILPKLFSTKRTGTSIFIWVQWRICYVTMAHCWAVSSNWDSDLNLQARLKAHLSQEATQLKVGTTGTILTRVVIGWFIDTRFENNLLRFISLQFLTEISPLYELYGNIFYRIFSKTLITEKNT
jgi:hypothetical protein